MYSSPSFILLFYLYLHTQVINAQNLFFSFYSRADAVLEKTDILSGGFARTHSFLHIWDRRTAEQMLSDIDSIKTGEKLTKELGELYQILADKHSIPIPSKKENQFHTGNSYEGKSLLPNCRKQQKAVLSPSENFRPVAKCKPKAHWEFGKNILTNRTIFTNMKGGEVNGKIARNWFFYSSFEEIQAQFPAYIYQFQEKYGTLPGVGFYKSFKSKLYQTDQAYDFMNATGLLGWRISPVVKVEFGHNRHFIGSGVHSLLLSGYAPPFLSAKINAHFGKWHYQWLLGELSGGTRKDFPGDRLIPRKYIAIHTLSIKIRHNIHLGFFEAVVFSRSHSFDIQYLNPVIIYRVTEQMNGSADNMLIGIDLSYIFKRSAKFYGQLLFDEFKLGPLLLERKGWWGNKYSIQLGCKIPHFASIQKLDMQAELNLVRPYTYSHRDSMLSYTHFNQPLAHPLGSNFMEYLCVFDYYAGKNWFIKSTFVHILRGDDEEGLNWGSNPLTSNNTRVFEYHNRLLQGRRSKLFIFRMLIGYHFLKNGQINLNLQLRKKQMVISEKSETSLLIGIGFQLNTLSLPLNY